MFLGEIRASDPRFKRLSFGPGMNMLIADRTDQSAQGDSRNGTGKSSLVRILRYVLGGSLPEEFKVAALADHAFSARLFLPAGGGESRDDVLVTRPLSPATRVTVQGWSETGGRDDLHVDEWRSLLSTRVYGLPEEVLRPTAGQLWGQLIRTYFGNPTKSHATETDWETGVKLGYWLGLSPEVLSKAGELDRLTKRRKAIRGAIREGALPHLSLDEAGLRAELVTVRRQRDRLEQQLQGFKIDEQYAEHQIRADALSAEIEALNDEALTLQRRVRELTEAIQEDLEVETNQVVDRLNAVYAEMRIVLPDLVARRFEEVAAFHTSVIANRRTFLEQERDDAVSRLRQIDIGRRGFDDDRARVMELLRSSVALDTFLRAQAELAGLSSRVADYERRLESAISIGEIDNTIRVKTVETVNSVRGEVRGRQSALDSSIALFDELGNEVYRDRAASLLVSTTPRGLLDVRPQVSGDASDGIKSVETFLLDMVCMVANQKTHRGPGLLVHDSHLFDSIDARQVASCLNIGARLADEYDFQYIVTMNSDFLESVIKQSDGGFDPLPYEMSVRINDLGEDGGLFGFRFQ